jgi:hypothetical protein
MIVEILTGGHFQDFYTKFHPHDLQKTDIFEVGWLLSGQLIRE